MRFHVSPLLRAVYSLIVVCALLSCDQAKSDPTPPASQNPAEGSTTAADLSAGKLAGLYVRQKMIPLFMNGRMTFNLQREFFYFFPDGHVLFGLPESGIKEHPTAADFAQFQKVAPELRGTYAVKGDSITFKPEKGDASTEPFSIPKPGDDSVLQIGEKSVVGSVKAVPFKDGQKLDGAYQYDGTIGLGGDNTIFNVNTLTFHPDGTLGSNQLSGVDTKGIDTTVGNSGVTTHSNAASAGTYQFSGYTLETKVNGKTTKATAFRWAGDDNVSAPGMICIGSRVYSKQEPAK